MSLDLSVFHYGSVPEDVKNSVYAASFSVVNLGGRYRFNAGRLSATLRAQVLNVTDVYVWNIGYSPGYFQFPPRTAIVYLTVEI